MLSEDEFGNRYVVIIADSFSKFIGLYLTLTRDFIGALKMDRNFRTDKDNTIEWRLSIQFKSCARASYCTGL